MSRVLILSAAVADDAAPDVIVDDVIAELYGALVAVYLYSRIAITFGPSMTSVRDLTRVAASEDYRLAHGAAAR